jgi:hypothetical protein
MQRLLLFIWWKEAISDGERVHWTHDEKTSLIILKYLFLFCKASGAYF